jgi:phospholipid-binding lipoprotein MlaA
VCTIDAFGADKKIPDLLSDELYDDESDDGAVAQSTTAVIYDPLEPVNRQVFAFNDKLYDYVLKPVTNAYIWLLPKEVRGCFSNFFSNIEMPSQFINSLLQLDFEASSEVLGRFLINSTIGIWGMVDVAEKHFHLAPHPADFGQTLGKWGVGEGLYICWPVIGPRTARDTFGFVVDNYTNPVTYLSSDNMYVDGGYFAATKIDSLSMNPDLYDDLRKYSLDPYVAIRQAYYDYRRTLVGQKWTAVPRVSQKWTLPKL